MLGHMAGGRNSTKMNCPSDSSLATFKNSIGRKIWQVDALLVTEVVLASIIVGIGAYGQRYRHHPFTRFVFLGATTLFLPIVSSVVSTITNSPYFVNIIDDDTRTLHSNDRNRVPDPHSLSASVATCDAYGHFNVLLIWAFLVQIVMVNISTVAATEDREGRSARPPIDLIVQGVWTLYLGFICVGHDMLVNKNYLDFSLLLGAPFSLLCAKIVLKYYAFEKARRSFALGRNPGLTFVYMEELQVQEANRHHRQHSEEPSPSPSPQPPPPPLLVMREEVKRVEMRPRGYAFKDDDDSWSNLNNNVDIPVTLDRVWQLDDSAPLPISSPQLMKGLCFSFALFKLLRCRFSSYKLTNAGSMGTLAFFRSFSLQPGEHDRIFRVIADEISFAHDYYYSSLPISYAKCWLPIMNVLLSLLTIGYCIALAKIVISSLQDSEKDYQIACNIWWIHDRLLTGCNYYTMGRIFFDLVFLLLLPALVLIVEFMDVVSYVCSNWTKVTLICRFVNHASSQGQTVVGASKDAGPHPNIYVQRSAHASSHHSLGLKKWVPSLLLRCRWKLMMKHWDEKMSQCSVLVPHRRTTALLGFFRGLIHSQDQKWKVKVTESVKVCIIDALKSVIDEGLSSGAGSLRRSEVGESFLWACEGKKATSETVLIWHVATCILQLKPSYSSSDNHKVAAIQLSQYCAYLMSWCPELLPDNNAWCRSLYKAVKKDTERAITECRVTGSSTPEADEWQKLVALLSANSNHEVVKNGVKLGKQLVETTLHGGEETVWKLLAGFWSEMVMYVAPSDDLKAHSEAIASGGELITLLWALLFHAGIVSRPGEEDSAAPTTSADAV